MPLATLDNLTGLAWWRSLRFKVVLVVMLTIACTLGVVLANSHRLATDALEAQTKAQLDALQPLLNASLAARVFQRDHSEINSIVQQLVLSPDTEINYIVVENLRGEILAAAGDDTRLPAPDSSVLTALDDLTYHAQMDLTLAGETRVGTVRFGLSLAGLAGLRSQVLYQSLLITALTLPLALLLLLWGGHLASRKINGLLTATRRIIGGDYSQAIKTDSRDEIGLLAAAFNHLQESVARQINELEIRNRQLHRLSEENSRQLASLQVSEARYRTIFNAPSDAIFIHESPSGRITDVNRAMLAMYGFSYEEALSLTVADVSANVPPYTMEEAGRKITAAINQGPQRFEWHARRKNGELFWSEVSLRLASFNDQQFVIAVVRDIHDRKMAEQALANEKERLAITLQSIGDGVITTDRQGRIMLLNNLASQLTGWSAEEAAGRPLPEVFQIINERTGESCQNPVDQVLASRRTIALENHTVLIGKDGSRRPIADSGAPIHDQEGEIIGVVLVFRDMTEHQRLEKELLKVKKLESVGLLAAGIAHDFNNLLTAVMGNIDLARFLLKKEQPDAEQLLNLLADSKKAGLRAQGLTQQLLTFARGGDPIRKLASLVAVIKDSAAFVLRGSGVSCEYQIADDLWLAEIDQGQISQVIQNIVLNARQAMGENGRLLIGACNLAENEAPGPRRPGKFVAITISDNGPGIPQKDQELIFDPYYTTKENGSGLGLAICHSIVSKHDGYIEIASEPGTGTTFTILLPASRQSLPPTKPATAPEQQRQARILVMDDEEMVRRVLQQTLEHLGHQVSTVTDGKQALEAYRAARDANNPFDLVIMDLTIPGGMGGQEAVQKLHALDPKARVVVASGYADNPVLADYQAHGFAARLNKPIMLADLQRVMQQLLAD
ncbi:PAS domain S-box protein [Desulfurivibrio alkaliphilus]|uniref:histidine kinase n=1 Tax=Desulfurivibrio alkaliphilus (strain DSM 19089 / UNIQEM U267 / AHT2) TaxID=589865 RepID=D6Z0W8_DESAT|nr:PAS domain S-box protein [Desulfurivibrio alkaliphilus]ADH87228.1 multi-sensor hybrid histidine kinase [Desulfurivibrio alkaliphilus AHT 2]